MPSLWKIKSKDYGDQNIKDRDNETLLIEYREYYKEGTDRLGGVMVKASASRAEGRGSIPGRVMPKTLKMEF